MITQEEFSIDKCSSCGFLFTNPVPQEEVIGRYYESEVYVSHSNTKKGFKNFVYHLVRNFTLQRKVVLVKRYSPKGVLLDIGSGAGYFLNKAKQEGFETIGLEPSEEVRKGAIDEFNLDIRSLDNLYKLENNSVDVISMWHVLEHVYHLNKDLEQMMKVLKKDGTMIVAVPNPDSWDAHYYGELWGGWDVPRHLYHFRAKDVEMLFSKFNAEVVEIKPMQFDPVYVSMLSEQYRGKSVFHAIWFGMISYFNKNKYGCTSQIYVIKKK
ncbi:MAG: class I SAM-dependent methyltransferase [Crocinitomicaceae bacterium]|nr:class I SAM-dependent methyltransferase [Crocinitomicaceae bacterium]